jgi:type II secretory pathway component PulF
VTTRWRYRAAVGDGAVRSGVLDAPSRDAALEVLRRQAMVPVTLAPAAGAATRRLGLGAARAVWLRTVATLAGAGVPLDRALAFAAQDAGHPAVAAAADRAARAVADGAPLSAALRAEPAVFAPLDAALVAAGEAAGALAPALDRVARRREEAEALTAELRGALVYPTALAVATGVGVTVLLAVVVPRFAAMLAGLGGTLPWSTRALLAVSAVVTRGWPVLAAVAIGAVLIWRAVRADPAGARRLAAARRRWPVWGPLERALDTARLTRALGTLLDGGVALVPALRLAADAVGNAATRDQVPRRRRGGGGGAARGSAGRRGAAAGGASGRRG